MCKLRQKIVFDLLVEADKLIAGKILASVAYRLKTSESIV